MRLMKTQRNHVPSVKNKRSNQSVVRLHLVDVHHEHAQTETEGTVDGTEHEIEGEDEQLEIKGVKEPNESRSENGEELIQADEERV